jgi:hypothetical protein
MHDTTYASARPPFPTALTARRPSDLSRCGLPVRFDCASATPQMFDEGRYRRVALNREARKSFTRQNTPT